MHTRIIAPEAVSRKLGGPLLESLSSRQQPVARSLTAAPARYTNFCLSFALAKSISATTTTMKRITVPAL